MVDEVQEADDANSSSSSSSVEETYSQSVFTNNFYDEDFMLNDEFLNSKFDDEEVAPCMRFNKEEVKEKCKYDAWNCIGTKICSGGWFISEGGSHVLLAHDDCSCSYYDIVNSEEKALYKPPTGSTPNMWRDCWIIHAPDADGCSQKYVVAASAGNTIDYGFCSWDFYTKKVQAFHFENDERNNPSRLSIPMDDKNPKCWYKPCGKHIISTTTCQKTVRVFDIRNGDQLMKWELYKPVLDMNYSSPLQWRSEGLAVLAEPDFITTWDVNSHGSRASQFVSTSGQKVSALHVNNSDAELGGGVRQRISSTESQGNDGVFCTPESINVLDFRSKLGIGLTIPKIGVDIHSAFSAGDSIYIGTTLMRPLLKDQSSTQIQQFSMRMPTRILRTYSLPEYSKLDFTAAATEITQVWGNNSGFVMGVCGLGLFVFDTLNDNELAFLAEEEMYVPSFDYLGSRLLIISRATLEVLVIIVRLQYITRCSLFCGLALTDIGFFFDCI